MNARTETEVRAHGELLIRAFAPHETDPIGLCKKIRRLERVAHRAAERYCNGEMAGDDVNAAEQAVFAGIRRLLPAHQRGTIVVNLDPRGYALTLRPDAVPAGMITDWGGYGILAPDLSD